MMNIIIGILAVAFSIWAMIHIAKSKLGDGTKILWFAIVILIPLLGPTVYYFVKVS